MEEQQEHNEDCPCDFCAIDRIDFIAWCEGFDARWAARKEQRQHVDCGPLCPEHGDVRDTSAVR